MFYMDSGYIIFILPALIFSLWASARVKGTFKRYSKVASQRGITGAQAAQMLMQANGINDVAIEPISNSLGDYFDPQKKVVKLSVYNDTSIAGIAVACHEIGHAIQHQQGYMPVKLRTALVPITNFGARISWPLIIIGFLLCSMPYAYGGIGYMMLIAGVILFSTCVLFQLVTLPVEFDASRRALESIENLGFLSESELPGARKVLKAAALTYVAALAVSVAQLLRILVLVSGRRD